MHFLKSAGALLIAATATSPALAIDPVAARTVLDGVYTEDQAARGMETFMAKGCNGCHGPAMEGTPGGPALAGFNFTFKWKGKTLDGLLDYVRANMPPGRAGSLTDAEYTDIISAIIHNTKLPAGTTELAPDQLASITVVQPPKN